MKSDKMFCELSYFRLIPKGLLILIKFSLQILFINCIYKIWNFLKNDPEMRQNEKMMILLCAIGVVEIISDAMFIITSITS